MFIDDFAYSKSSLIYWAACNFIRQVDLYAWELGAQSWADFLPSHIF